MHHQDLDSTLITITQRPAVPISLPSAAQAALICVLELTASVCSLAPLHLAIRFSSADSNGALCSLPRHRNCDRAARPAHVLLSCLSEQLSTPVASASRLPAIPATYIAIYSLSSSAYPPPSPPFSLLFYLQRNRGKPAELALWIPPSHHKNNCTIMFLFLLYS